MAKSKKAMEIGSRHFYPPHGVVALVAVEDREFAGNNEEFHVLELVRGGTLLVPTKALGKTPFRPLISASKAKELVKRMRSTPKKVDASDTKERAAAYAEQLKNGDAGEYTDILRDLVFREKTTKITSTEERLLETARTYFIDEVGSVLKIDTAKVIADLRAAAEPEPEEADDAGDSEDSEDSEKTED